METSMRLDSTDKQLYLHAKENFVQGNLLVCQVHAKLNTATGKPGGTIQLRKKFLPPLLTSLDVGAKVEMENMEVTYSVQGKKTIELSDTGLLNLDVKGGYYFHANSKEGKSKALVELSQKVFNFTDDQDLKIKLGCNLVTKRPYFQIRENNWTLNADLNTGFKDIKWRISYDL